jgi:putative spermidine/putrescine transport system permease protein
MSGPRRAHDLSWLALKASVVLIYLFIIGPILITAVVSFNATNRSVFPPQGYTLRWWAEAFDARWMHPLAFSMELGACTALISTAIGLPLALALVRHEFRGKRVIEMMTVGPLILPTLVTGIALLQFLHLLALDALMGFWALLIGHVIICLPFAVRMVAISLKSMPASIELAAASLGAPPARVLREITLPVASGGVFAGIAFAFIHSFTDVNLSLFIARPAERPITVAILNFLEFGFAPTLAAVSIITLVIPLVLMAVLERFVRIGDFLHGERVGNG